MTKEELSKLRNLNREIRNEKKYLAWAKSARLKYTNSIDIDALNASIKSKNVQAMTEYDKLIRYVDSIDNSLIREIMLYRYVNGMTWVATAVYIGGGNNADGVRKIHDRFLSG